MEPDAGDKNRGDRNESDVRARLWQLKWNNRALILAEELFHSLERYGINIPCISGNVFHAANASGAWSMKAMVHACPEAQRHELAATVLFNELLIVQQLHQRIGKAFGLDKLVPLNIAEGADDGVARTHDDTRIAINRPDPVSKLAHETISKAGEVLSLGFIELDIRIKKPPGRQ